MFNDDATIDPSAARSVGPGIPGRGACGCWRFGVRPVRARAAILYPISAGWNCRVVRARRFRPGHREGRTMMEDLKWYAGYFVMFGGIALIGWIIALLDWLGQRQDRRSGRKPAA